MRRTMEVSQLAGVTHDVLLDARVAFPRLGTESPVGGEEQEQVFAVAVFLTCLEDSCRGCRFHRGR